MSKMNAARHLARFSRVKSNCSTRFSSTIPQTPHQLQRQASSPFAAGAIGGFTALGAGYVWYYFSGTKDVVDAAKGALHTAQQVKDTVKDFTPSPGATSQFIASTVKSYAKAVPGLGPFIEEAWKQLEEISKDHGDEVEKIVSNLYEELKKLAQSGKADAKTGDKALEIIQRHLNEALALLPEVGNDLFEKNPQIGKAVKLQFDELKKVVEENGGPEAKELIEGTFSKIKETLSKDGASPVAIATIASLLTSKLAEAKSLANDASSAAFEQVAKAAAPSLSKLPAVKELIENNSTLLKSLTGASGLKLVKDIYNEVQKVADGNLDKKSVEALQKFVVQKIEDAKKSGGAGGKVLDYAQSKFDSIPGIEKFVKKVPSFATLQTLVKEHGSEVEKLLEETYEEIEKVLSKKTEEAKKIIENGKKDVKKSTK